MNDDVLTVKEAARLAGCGIGEIYVAIRYGLLRTAPIVTRTPGGSHGRGSSIGIIRESLDEWLEKRNQRNG